jgi:GMP synthase (glutamine-hydrolysing)
MSKVTVIQHVEPEGPGTIAEVLRSRNLEVDVIRADRGQSIPESVGDMAALVVMGGPMGVHDTTRYPYLRDVMKLIDGALETHRPVLGVCLGSQLLAATLGADVRAAEQKEIGWHAVTLSRAADRDALFFGVEKTFRAFHWHGEVFDLPAGAVLLASSARTPCQAFRWGDHAYGLLFHLEVDATAIEQMVSTFGHELAQAGVEAQHIAAGSTRHLPALGRIARVVFGRWADAIDTRLRVAG